jgi:hypothetical protein
MRGMSEADDRYRELLANPRFKEAPERGRGYAFMPAGLPRFAERLNADEELVCDIVERSGRFHPSGLDGPGLHYFLMKARAVGAVRPVISGALGLDADAKRERDLRLLALRSAIRDRRPFVFVPPAPAPR